MSRRTYTVTVLVCAVSWLLVGLHIPVLHEFTHAEAAPRTGVLALTLAFFVMAVAGTWALLRARAPGGAGPTSEPPAA